MRKSGQISAKALKKVVENIKVGVSALDLEELAEQTIKKLGGNASFKSVKGYKWTSCITFNEQVVHGIPTDRVIQESDVVSVDLGAEFKGWHTDTAWSVLVNGQAVPAGRQDTGDSGQFEKRKFLETGEEALWLGIAQATEGNRIGDISQAIQDKVEGVGYSVVRSLVGHGVGRNLHEEPEVPGYGRKGMGMILKKGQTLAIEVIYTAGKPEVILEKDGWTVSSADGSMAGLFEMSVIVGKDKPEVLTWRK